MRKYGKVDQNQRQIVEALRAHGATCQSIASVGRGAPDILVGFRGQNWLLEVKVGKAKLTTDETDWSLRWAGQYAVVRSVDEALAVVGIR